MEMDILTVLVPETDADAVFAFLYTFFELDKKNNGVVFQQPVESMSEYTLPLLADNVGVPQ